MSDLPALAQGLAFASAAASTASRLISASQHMQGTANEDSGAAAAAPPLSSIAEPDQQAPHLNQRGETLRPLAFAMGQLIVRVPAGAAVRLDDTRGCYVLEGGQATVGGADPASQGPIKGTIEIAAANHEDAGTVRLRAEVPSGLLSASIRYFYPTANGPAGFRYPLFQMSASGSVETELQIDPVHPLDPSRNQAIFAGGQAGPSAFFTASGQPLLLRMIAGKSGTTNQWDPVENDIYAAPLGDWELVAGASGASGPIDLMCGLSGLEFARLDEGSVLRFVPGAPAYAQSFPEPSDGSTQPLISDCPLSDWPVTTSWIYVISPKSVPGYFSQPVTGGLFEAKPQQRFLPVLQLQSAGFPPAAQPVFGSPAASFPMAPYGRVSPLSRIDADLYRRFEIELLSTMRSNAIFAMNWEQQGTEAAGAGNGPRGIDGLAEQFAANQMSSLSSWAGATAPFSASAQAVTPQGMYSIFSPDHQTWERLFLASTQGGRLRLELRSLDERLRAALLTPQLFLVISDAKAFEQACTVLFPALAISGWTFNPAPKEWLPDTVLILKFADKSLEELIDDRSLWSTAGSGLNHGAATQAVLKAWITEARGHEGQLEFQYFLNTVLRDWNGALFANVKTPPAKFPSALRALAAGLDLATLKAHHLGLNLSPLDIREGIVTMSDSSLFGLIYYQDVQDLVYAGYPYDFKVLSLRVLFANSEISSFASQVELLVGKLFGERSTLNAGTHGDNLVLNGVMQRHGDEESYSFSMQGSDKFSLNSKVLDSITVNQAQFVTLPQAVDTSAITARFLLWGSMRFLDHPAFDLFSFGPVENDEPTSEGLVSDGPSSLQFSNMFVSMTYIPEGPTAPTGPTGPTGPSGPTGRAFAPADQEKRTFTFQAEQMVFDLAGSVARPHSLYAHFPVQLTGMVQGNASTTPASLGFVPVETPLDGGALGDVWFGLRLSLSLGSQGGLASQAGFNASLLAAWAPSNTEPNALLAIQLPGALGGIKELNIEGPLKLSVGSFAMLFNPADAAYLMRFNNIVLSLFSLKFPPGGTSNLLLFGDPGSEAKNTTLGWYAAYQKNPSTTGKTEPKAVKTLDAQTMTKRTGPAAQTIAECGCSEPKRS